MNRLIIFICLITSTISVFAQLKYEKETRITEKEVSENIVSFIDSMNLQRKIRWYKEIGYNKISYEAKTKYRGKRLSIEFSEDGTFEDFEIEIKLNEILPETLKNISDYLLDTCRNYKIEKVQIQYSGDTNLILNYFLNKETENGLIVHYEIVISTKEDGKFVMYEYLFDKSGAFVRKSKIKLSMTDNILF